MDPEAYMKRALQKGVVFTVDDEAIIEGQKQQHKFHLEEELDYYMK
jgi:hypothetical protein